MFNGEIPLDVGGGGYLVDLLSSESSEALQLTEQVEIEIKSYRKESEKRVTVARKVAETTVKLKQSIEGCNLTISSGGLPSPEIKGKLSSLQKNLQDIERNIDV